MINIEGVKVPDKLMDDIQKPDDKKEYPKLIKEVLYSEGEDEKKQELVKEIYLNIIDILKKYLDLKEDYYPILALWIIGTHCHNQFYTYPYLFLNAMKGSGKTRLLKLINILANKSQMLNSLTEAVLFRTEGTLCIDEFEAITRTGSENLRELLNSAYKRGTTVKRMRKVKAVDGEKQEVESFVVYRPIAIANINGMETVLGDRCIPLIIEKSSKSDVTRLIEMFELDPIITSTLDLIRKSDVSDVTLPLLMYTQWNDFIYYKHHTSQNNNITKHHLMNKIYDSGIDGRHLELALPLLVIANYLGEDIFDNILRILKEIVSIKKEDEFTDNADVSVIDFVSQYTSEEFRSIKELTKAFKDFTQSEEQWINERWFGRALKRLALIVEKKHTNHGAYVRLDINKAQQRITMFK